MDDFLDMHLITLTKIISLFLSLLLILIKNNLVLGGLNVLNKFLIIFDRTFLVAFKFTLFCQQNKSNNCHEKLCPLRLHVFFQYL